MTTPDTDPKPPTEQLYLNLRDRYSFTCPVCDHYQQAAPSLFMQTFQANVGGGHCLKCDSKLHLSIDAQNERMIAEQVTVPERYTELFVGLPETCYAPKAVVLAARDKRTHS